MGSTSLLHKLREQPFSSLHYDIDTPDHVIALWDKDIAKLLGAGDILTSSLPFLH